ncbi:hypothetical protein [Candidatus Uabimicrobium sp. HlEnr_7]|uniref:hypothetical protein n=1 Tax=Candidatus Uabimicrobium helgolandensis TaxID=3095367 RepID=UPI003555CEB3
MVGGKNEGEILSGLRKVISAENDYFNFTLASGRYTRPDTNRKNQKAVVPDHRITTNRNNIISGNDPQLNWIKNDD